MLRRFIYREEPFELLDKNEIVTLIFAFNKLLCYIPEIFHWVHPLGSGCFLVTGFYHKSMSRYHGLEVVIVEGDAISYSRLPGAKVGGTGNVSPGVYKVKVTSPNGIDYCVDVKKNRFGNFELLAVKKFSESNAIDAYVPLERRPLEVSKFADEIRNTIHKGVEWIYQYYLINDGSQGDILMNPELETLLQVASGLTSKTDAFLSTLKSELF